MKMHPSTVAAVAVFVIALLTGVVGATLVYASGSGFTEWLFKWQPLVGTAIATAAAIVTIFVLVAQIKAQKAIEDRRRKAALQGARAVLREDLSLISGYSREVAEVICMFAQHFRNDRARRPRLTNPTLSRDVLENLKALAALVHGHQADHVIKLVGRYQVLRSRLEGLLSEYNPVEAGANHCVGRRDRVLAEHEISSILGPLGELELRVRAMFDFADGGEMLPPTGDVAKAWFIFNIFLNLEGTAVPRTIVDDAIASLEKRFPGPSACA
jgi:hypothetical protein